jgi:integrase
MPRTYNDADRRRAAGPLAKYVDGFTATLRARGYSDSCVSLYQLGVIHLGAWCERRTIWPAALDDGVVDRFIRAAEGLEPTTSLRPATFKTLIGLLAATGLRVSEARGLRLDDVRTEDRSLFVRQGKCGKSRVIPIHGSTLSDSKTTWRSGAAQCRRGCTSS